MKEYFDNAEFAKYFIVQQQALFFLLAYHAYIEARSILRTVLTVLVFLWLTSGFFRLDVVFTGLIGLVLAILTSLSTSRTSKNKSKPTTYVQLYYYVIQPGILFFVLPLYVDQTEFPVGMFVATILWLGCNGIVWIINDDNERWQYSTTTSVILEFSPVFFLFLFSAIFSRMRWLPIILTVSIQIFFLVINIILRFSSRLIK